MDERTLPSDYARCNGTFVAGRLGLPCVSCLRRTSPPPREDHYEMVSPALVVDKHFRQRCINHIGSE